MKLIIVLLSLLMLTKSYANDLSGAYSLISGDQYCSSNLNIKTEAGSLTIMGNQLLGNFLNQDLSKDAFYLPSLKSGTYPFDLVNNEGYHLNGHTNVQWDNINLLVELISNASKNSYELYDLNSLLSIQKVNGVIELHARIKYDEIGLDEADFNIELNCLYK